MSDGPFASTGWPAEVVHYYQALAESARWPRSMIAACIESVNFVRDADDRGEGRRHWEGPPSDGVRTLFETVDDERAAGVFVKQLQLLDDGTRRRYWWRRLEDDGGGLTEAGLEESLASLKPINAMDFYALWDE